MSAPGTRIGPYVILGRLGAGGMGVVHLARDSRLERDVALKMLPAELAHDELRMSLFRSEALALAAINHPNIATVYGIEESEQGVPVLVLERVEGESLASLLARGAPAVTEALRVCVQVAEAVEAAHSRGVIHRDLKPGNVMMGANGLVKVLDFGLAQTKRDTLAPRHSDSLAPTRLAGPVPPPSSSPASHAEDAPTTPIGSRSHSSGTPGYMSPEQSRGEVQDERTDVFAFGCVLFECLTGAKAFTGATDLEIRRAVLETDPDLRRLPPATPPRIRALLARCLEKELGKRLGSMREARLEIEETLGIRRASALRAGEALAGPPNNLPRQPTSFIGRERAVRDCIERLRAARLLTVTGVGGSGKTRIALRVAETLLPEYADGVWFVDLAALSDPERVPQAAATALGVPEEAGRSLTQTLARHIADRRLLLVLDNCEHLLASCAALIEALLETSAESRVIATSREGLGVRGEHTYPVPSLVLPSAEDAGDPRRAEANESIRLFVDRARLVASEFALSAETAPIVAEICRRLDGIPLAIELAAARVRMLSVEQIREKLHDRFRLLGGGSKAALPRHQTLRAAIQWSYDHLAPDEQELLRALSVFAGGWTLDAAVTVCGAGRDEFEVLDLSSRLADKSLVVVERPEAGEPRYRFLETVRQYGRELSIEGGEGDALRVRHRDWLLAFAERAARKFYGPDQAQWMDRVEDELENLRAALEWSLEQDPDPGPAIRLVAAAQLMMIVRGHFQECRAWMEAALAKGRDAAPSAELASLFHGAGNVCFRLDDYDAARGHYERALAMREQLGDQRAAAGTLGALGNVAQYQGRLEEARVLFERSLTINRELNNQVWVATNLTCLGNCTRLLGDFPASRRYLDQAVALNHEIGNPNGEAYSLDGLGCLLRQMGEHDAARAAFEDALVIERAIGDVHEMATTLCHLGGVLAEEGEAAIARERFAEAIRLLRSIGARGQIAAALEEMAKLAAIESQPERVVRLCAAARAIRDAIGLPADTVEQQELFARLAAARNELGEAAYAAAWEQGGRLSPDEAIEEGLREAGVGRA